MRREQLSSETGLQVSRTQMRMIGGLFKQKKETKQQPEKGRSEGLGVYCVAFGFTQSIKLCQILGEKQGEAKMMALKEGQRWALDIVFVPDEWDMSEVYVELFLHKRCSAFERGRFVGARLPLRLFRMKTPF